MLTDSLWTPSSSNMLSLALLIIRFDPENYMGTGKNRHSDAPNVTDLPHQKREYKVEKLSPVDEQQQKPLNLRH